MRDRKSNRLKGYDYSKDNLYFITSCIQDRVCCFGRIIFPDDKPGRNPSMILNDYGKIAEKQWHWLSDQYPYVILHAFVAMPNHIHGIIEINKAHIRLHDEPLKIKPLSELMGAYKTTVSKKIHLAGYSGFSWQRSYYEHVIKNDETYDNIFVYIKTNPLSWEKDKFYPGPDV